MIQDPMPGLWLPYRSNAYCYQRYCSIFSGEYAIMLLCIIIPSNKLGYVKDSDK